MFAPVGLQSGAATADGAPEIPMAKPPASRPALIPAMRRRASILLIFIISVVL